MRRESWRRLRGVDADGALVNRFPAFAAKLRGETRGASRRGLSDDREEDGAVPDKNPADIRRRGFQVMRLLSGVFAVEGVEEVYEFFTIFLGRRPGKDFVRAFH